MNQKSIHVFYRGRVQGVCFRATTQEIASELGVKGWVANRADGSVELVAQGSEDMLLSFLERIRNSFRMYIRNEDIQWLDAQEDFVGFKIEYTR